MLRVSIIFASGENNILGINNDLYVSIRKDLQYFRSITTDSHNKYPNIIVMGYTTWKSLPKELPNRKNIIISNNHYKELHDDNQEVYHSYEEFIERYKTKENYGRIFIIGGSTLYQYVMENYENSIDYIYQTFIHDVYPKPALFQKHKDKFSIYDFKLAHRVQHKGTFIKMELPECEEISEGRIFNIETNEYENKQVHYTHIVYSHKSLELNRDELQYLQLMKHIQNEGMYTISRNSVVYSSFGHRMEFNLQNNTIPILTTKRVPWKTVLRELLWFLSGSTNNQDLIDKKVMIWNQNASKEFLESQGLDYEENDLGPVYGFQWRHFGAHYKDCHTNYDNQGKDQLQWLINEIKTNPNSRRLLLNSWNASDIDKMALPPCHVMVQFYINTEENTMDAQLYQRSGDMFLGVPFNITSYALLMFILGKLTGYSPKRLIHIIGDAHIYDCHNGAVQEQLNRVPMKFPKISIRDIEDIDSIQESDIQINDYNHFPTIKAPMIA
jgi:thymidylate synthase/dihydrofolate reductase